MQTEAFKKWLRDGYVQEKGKSKGKRLARRAQENRVFNCNTVEQSEGNLDGHFRHDEMRSLLNRLSYSSDDRRKGRSARHGIKIDGDIANGTSTYKSATNLYRKFLISQQAVLSAADDSDETRQEIATGVELTALEGAEHLLLIRHRKREQFLRDAKVAEARKFGNGKLKCEVPKCGFDFEVIYGELGRDYAQVHHLKPLADRTKPSQTKLDDLAVVCANCHAMIHRGGKCRSLDKLIP